MCPIVTRNKEKNQKQLRACFVFIFVIQELNRENKRKKNEEVIKYQVKKRNETMLVNE